MTPKPRHGYFTLNIDASRTDEDRIDVLVDTQQDIDLCVHLTTAQAKLLRDQLSFALTDRR